MANYYYFGIEFEYDETQQGLVAAGNRWTTGGNSPIARRLRVAMQRRDRYGRWAEMGGGISFPGRWPDGSVENFVGRYIGPAERPDYMRVLVTSGRRPGIYEVPSRVATVSKALLSEEALKEAGVKLDVNGNRVGEILDRDIEFVDNMWKGNKPTEFELSMARGQVSKPEKRVIAKARLRAPAHKSYNIVDEKGNRIDKDEAPETPKAKIKGKKKPAQKFPLPDLDKELAEEAKTQMKPEDYADEAKRAKWIAKQRKSREFWVGPDGKRLKDGMVTDAIKADPKNYRVRDYKNSGFTLDGNGEVIPFEPEFSPSASPLPTREEDKVVVGDDGFANVANIRPGEIRTDITDARELYEHLYNGGFAEAPIDLVWDALTIASQEEEGKYLGRHPNPYIETHDSRDPKFVGISNILQSLPRWQENRLERAISLSLMGEEQLDAFKAWLDENVEDGVPLTDAQLVDAHKKFRNLGVDITNIKVKGTNIFTNDNLGALRRNMPQLDDADQAEFLAELDRLGIKHENGRVNVKDLKPIQAEMDMSDVAFLALKKFFTAEGRKEFDGKRLVVTRDGYILDGHHRYAAAYLASLKTGEPIELDIVRLDLDHDEALRLANEWNDHAGIFRQQIGGRFVAEPRPPVKAPEAPEAPGPEIIQTGRPAVRPRFVPSYNQQNPPSGDGDNIITPNGEKFNDWFEKNLANNGDKILTDFADKLTRDTPTPNPRESKVDVPGSKTVVTNLLKYRDGLITGLKESALIGDKEGFKFKYEVAKRVVNLLNKIYENFANGQDYKKDTEIALSTSNPDVKLDAFRLLPETMKTQTDQNGIKIIESFDAITIGKNGAPYLINWRANNSGDVTASAVQLNADGSVPTKAEAQASLQWGGYLRMSGLQQYIQGDKPGVFIPTTAQVGSAFTNEYHQGMGLMSGWIMLSRWVQTQFMKDGRLSHSGNLRPNGTFYGKTVSKDMKDHVRDQADKAVHQNCPNGDIFKVLKAMRLVDGEYIPFDKNAKDSQPGGFGKNSGGTGWLKRLTLANTTGGGDTRSVLTPFSINSVVENYYAKYVVKNDEEKQRILDAMPPIFRDYFAGDSDRVDWKRLENFDVQYKLLGTVYKDGMNKQETLDFLDSLITGLPRLVEAFGGDPQRVRDKVSNLEALRAGVEGVEWNEANNQYNRPIPFDQNKIKVVESPFAGHFKFSNWVVSKDTKRIMNELPFTPRPRKNEDPVDWTEDPQVLSDRYGSETLLASLRDAIINEKGNVAHLPNLGNEGQYENNVTPTAVYKALENKGYDTELILAGIYDEINGNDVNTRTLLERRAELGNLNEVLDKLQREVGKLDSAIEFQKIGGGYQPEKQILQSDIVKRHFLDSENDPSSIAIRDLALDNERLLSPDGRTVVLDSRPHAPEIPSTRFYTDGVADNPKIIARNFNTQGLFSALIDSTTNGRTTVALKFPNGTTIFVKNEAIRDALQHQGFDVNAQLLKTALKPEPKKLFHIDSLFRNNPDGSTTRFYAIGREDAVGLGIREISVSNRFGNKDIEISLVNLSQNPDSPIARIAKLTQNDQDNYSVWVANREDKVVEELGGDPAGVYKDIGSACYDIDAFLKSGFNIRETTSVLRNQKVEPRERQEHDLVETLEGEKTTAIVNGVEISLSPSAKKAKIYTNAREVKNFRRIPGLPSTNLGEKVFVEEFDGDLPDGAQGKIKSVYLAEVSVGPDGKPVRKNHEIYRITKISDDKFTLNFTYYAQDGSTKTETLDFSDPEIADAFAKIRIISGKTAFSGKERKFEDDEWNFVRLIDKVDSAPPKADINSQVISQTPQEFRAETPVNFNGGIKAKLSVAVQKGKHPAWRRNERNEPYVFAEANITNEYGELVKVKVVRTGIRDWSLVIEGKTASSESGQLGLNKNLKTRTLYFNDKMSAFENFRERLNSEFPSEEGKSVVPKVRLDNQARAQEYITEPEAIGVQENYLSDSVFDAFLTERQMPIGLATARDIAQIRGGASHSRIYETPDGRKFKVKIEGGNKARQESFNHALYILVGAPSTPARLGLAPRTTVEEKLRKIQRGEIIPEVINGLDVVVADAFEPDIVKRNGQNLAGQTIFSSDALFRDPAYAQARKDLQEGLLIDCLIGNGDMEGNTGNSFVALRDGVARGIRCDNGSGGLYQAIGHGRSQRITSSGRDAVVNMFGDFMSRGAVNDLYGGGFRRGLTKDGLIEIARRTLLPLTDDKIDRLVDAVIVNDADKRDLKSHLKRRRLEMLGYMGIDPNEGISPSEINRRGLFNPNAKIADGSPYEIGQTNANGAKIVKFAGATRGADGVIRADISTVPSVIKDGLITGQYVPESFPAFLRVDGNTENTLIFDSNGILRPNATAGYTSLFIRKRMVDGSYKYLLVTQKTPKLPYEKANAGKRMPIQKVHKSGEPLPTAQQIIDEELAPGIQVVGSKEFMLDIPGMPLGAAASAKHRIMVVDIGSQDIGPQLTIARDNNKIQTIPSFKSIQFLETDKERCYNQLNGAGERRSVIDKVQEWERNWTSSPSNQPSENESPGDGTGGGSPSGPSGGDGGNIPSDPFEPSPGETDDNWRPFSRVNLLSNQPGFPFNQVGFDLWTRDDGAIAIVQLDTTVGFIKPLKYGHWVATFLPREIGNNNNGNAAKAIFKNKKDAENWLSKQIFDKYGIDQNNRNQRFATEVGPSGDRSHDPNVQPPFVVNRGYLNPTTQAQRKLASKLVRTKKATPEERAMYKAILMQRNPNVGDVGWVIGQLKDREDRDLAEIKESNQAEENANAGNVIRPSSLENAGDGSNRPHAVRAKDLKVGHRILGNVNGNVVFTVPGENDTVNIGVVGDDGQLKIYKVNNNRMLDCIFGRQVAPAAPAQPQAANPGVAVRQARIGLIQDAVKTAYPNTRDLPNGDMVIGQRDHRMADGRVFRYEAVVHKLKSDEFVGYVRRQLLDANGNPTGTGEAAYLTEPAHSPRALKNRLSKIVMRALNAANPANGFNQPNNDRQPEVIDPATGLPLPESLVSQKKFIGTTGIEKTGHPAKDALIEYVQTLVARGVSAPDIINQVVGPNQRLFSRNQMDDIIDRLEANRLYPGVNVIPYVSKDNKTIVRVGDRVIHYDAYGNPKLMANGQPRTGTVTRRVPYTLNMKPNGEYEYTDQVFVQWDDTSRPHQAAPRRLEVTRRADGTEPIPAVQDNDSTPPSPSIDTLPMQPKRVVPRPVAPSRRGQQPGVTPTVQNVRDVRFVEVNGVVYNVERYNEGTQFRRAGAAGGGLNDFHPIYVVPGGNGGWVVKDGINNELARFSNRNEAEFDAINRISNPAEVQPVEPFRVAFDGRAGNTNEPDLTVDNVDEFAKLVGFDGLTYNIDRGQNMTRFEAIDGNRQLNDVFVHQLADGKWHVRRAYNDAQGNRQVQQLDAFDDRKEAEVVAIGRIIMGDLPPLPGETPVAENNISITDVTDKLNAYRRQIPYQFTLKKDTVLGGNLGDGVPIILVDESAQDAGAVPGLNGLRGQLEQNGDALIIKKWDKNQRYLGGEIVRDLDDGFQKLVSHAIDLRLQRDRKPSSPTPSPSDSNPPSGGDGGGLPPNNPPAGGGGASSGILKQEAVDLDPVIRNFVNNGRGDLTQVPGGLLAVNPNGEEIAFIANPSAQNNNQFTVTNFRNGDLFYFPNKEQAIIELGNMLRTYQDEQGFDRVNLDATPQGDGSYGPDGVTEELDEDGKRIAKIMVGSNEIIRVRDEEGASYFLPNGVVIAEVKRVPDSTVPGGYAWSATSIWDEENSGDIGDLFVREGDALRVAGGKLENAYEQGWMQSLIKEMGEPEPSTPNDAGPGLNLSRNEGTGAPAQGVAPRRGIVPKVNTFWDNDYPPTRYEVVRDENGTKFVGIGGDNVGAQAFMRVEKTPEGNWKVVDPRRRRGIDPDEFPAQYGDRYVAEALAINKMSGNDALNREILNPPSETPASRPEPTPQIPVLDLPWNDKRNQIQPREIGAVRSFELVEDFGNGAIEPIRIDIVRDENSTTFIPDGYEPQITRVDKFEDGWGVSGLTSEPDEVVMFDSRAEAEAAAVNAMRNFNSDLRDIYVQQQFEQRQRDLNPEAPNNPPAGPLAQQNQNVPAQSPAGAPKNIEPFIPGKINIGAPDGGQDYRQVVPEKHPDAVLTSLPPKYFGDYNPGVVWVNPDGTVARWNDERDGGPQPRNPLPWENNQPPLSVPGSDNNPTQPTPNGNAPAQPPVPPAQPPAEPAQLDEQQPAQQPRFRTNPVKPGDRYIKTRSRRDPNGGPQTLFDIYDRKTRKIIANARTWQEANDIANGVRDLNGKLIDYNTPIQPRERLAPSRTRPQGYRRIANGNGYYLENSDDPSGPVARVDLDEAKSNWIGALYANKEDAIAQRNAIEEFFDSSQDSIYEKANLAVQKELDRRNPPALKQAEVQPLAQGDTGTRTDLGDGIFSVGNRNEEYALAIRGDDGKWSVRVHQNARDAATNTNPIATGTYDTPEEAEAAIRKAIAERQAQRNAANILRWQSASDGKAYLGLDGVRGVDAENAPIYGISPSPFGNGWISAGWRNKAQRDAGSPPSIVAQHQDEQEAKNHVQKEIGKLAELLGIRVPPMVIEENPNAGRQELPPGVTIQDQVDAGLTTPFNPNAPLPNTPSQ